jgi:hypothetical protein
MGNLPAGLGDASLHADMCVEVFGFLPEFLCLDRIAGVGFEKSVAPDSI